MADRGRLLVGGQGSFHVALALLAAGAVAFVVLAILGEIRSWLLLLVTLMVVGGAAAISGWQRAARAALAVARLEDARGSELDERIHELEQGVDERDRRIEALERARQRDREWTRELRGQIWKLQHERGVLGETKDVRALVLKVALALLEAEKGLLLSHEDADSDGDLDLVAAEGFRRDPADSAVAQHFASCVLERDATVRADDVDELPVQDRKPADEEIENLVAIPIYIRDDFHGVVVAANKPGGFRDYEDEVLLALGDHAGAVLQNARLHGELRTSYLATVRMLADAIEVKDPFLRGHSDEVTRYVARVADKLGIDPRHREELVFASLLHDIGKIEISERILLKPTGLTPEERSVIELHPRIGYRLVQQVPALRNVATGVLHHHERFDGDGYPSRLRGEEIPLEARIIAVADSFSAMTADRPYRKRMTPDDACSELERCAGTQFDPEVVRLFCEEVRRQPREGPRTEELALVLADPELQARREKEEPLLGFGAIAAVDNLTLLYSHRYLHEVAHAEAERAAVQGRGFGVVTVEIAELDRINRDEGYRAGDETIRVVARAVQEAAAECEGTACRASGRRLALIVPGADEKTTAKCAESISQALNGGPGVGVGFAVWGQGDSGDAVIARSRPREAVPAGG